MFFVRVSPGEEDWAKRWLEIPNNENFDEQAAAIRQKIPMGKLQVAPESPHLYRAAIHDLNGDFHQAMDLYRKGIGRTMTPPFAARKHLIRILRDHFPEKLKDPIWELKQFEDHIAWIELLATRPRAGATGKLFGGEVWKELANMEGSISKSTYGEFAIPPLWKPDLSMTGKFPNRFRPAGQEIIKLRRDTFETWCRGAFENPELTSWAFSRLGALADLDGRFENNPELINLARTALKKSKRETLFGAIPEAECPYYRPGHLPVRTYSPELYLAWHISKGYLQAGDLVEDPGIDTRLQLLTCHATDFFNTMDSLIGRDLERTLEAIQIWELRQENCNLLEHMLVFEESPDRDSVDQIDLGNGKFQLLIPGRRPVRSWLRVFDRVAQTDTTGKRIENALERLAVCYIGPPEKQKQLLNEALPPPGVIVCGTESKIDYYIKLLNGMMTYPSLADTATQQAGKLVIRNRIYRKAEPFPFNNNYVATKDRTKPRKTTNSVEKDKKDIQSYINAVNSSKDLKIDPRKFVPRTFDGKGAEGEKRQLREGVLLTARQIGDQLPPEYLFFAAQGRWGWVSYEGRNAVSEMAFLNSVADEFQGTKRDIIKAGLILGSHKYDFIYNKNVSGLGWKNPQVAEAFEYIGSRIANRSLPANLRLALATLICRDCGRHVPPRLSIQFAEMLIDEWDLGTHVPTDTEEAIISGFINCPETDERWNDSAKELLWKWVENRDNADVRSAIPVLMLAIAARLNDRDMINRMSNSRWEAAWKRDPLMPLLYLIREGRIEDAQSIHQIVLPMARERYIRGRPSILRSVFYDKRMQRNLPRLLEKINTSQTSQIFVKMMLNYMYTDPFETGLDDLATRLEICAHEFAKTDFTGAEEEKMVCLKLLANDYVCQASAIVADQYLDVVQVDQFHHFLNSKNYYQWKWALQAMIKSLIVAERFDEVLAALHQVDDVTEVKSGNYAVVWKEFSDAVSSGVTLHQNDPGKLSQMLPITQFMAQLPPSFVNSDRTRAGNYARNIFCHGLLDRMDEWKQWRLNLPEQVRTELDTNWFPQSGWMIGLTKGRIKNDHPVQFRVDLMKRFLSHPEVIGPEGTLHNKAIDEIIERGYLTRTEMLEHGKPLVDAIADGGNADAAFQELKIE